MPDVFTPEKRSQIMRRIKSKNTKPELLVRRALYNRGFRYRLHVRSLPGNPDIVLSKYSTIIQVHGCFWHYHNCGDGHIPKSKISYWANKLEGNKQRDTINDQSLKGLGWDVIIVWECEISSNSKIDIVIEALTARLRNSE